MRTWSSTRSRRPPTHKPRQRRRAMSPQPVPRKSRPQRSTWNESRCKVLKDDCGYAHIAYIFVLDGHAYAYFWFWLVFVQSFASWSLPISSSPVIIFSISSASLMLLYESAHFVRV